MSDSRRRIGSSLLIVWTATFVVVAIVVVLAVSLSLQALARQEARDKASIIIARSLAVHSYINTELKPNVFKLSDQIEGPEYFDPVWMSSTYAVRDIQRRFNELIPDHYYYKECAIDARSPQYEADEAERAFIKRTNADDSYVKESMVRDYDGVPYLVVMERGELLEASCMRCHSDPELAPADLVKEYGPTRSFGRTEGEYASAISVRVSLADAYASASTSTRNLSLILLGVFGLSLSGVYAYNRKTVFVPARKYQADADALSEAVESERELNEELAAVNEELSATNDEVVQAMHMRERAEEELEQYKESLEELVSTRTADLERSMSEAESANEAKSLFLANISHDLRTPLNSVIGFSDVLISGIAGDMNDEQLKQLQMINDSGKYLLSIVSDLLDLSRIENATESVTIASTDLTLICGVALDHVRPICAEKGIGLVSEGCDGHIQMHTDGRLLLQLLLNVLGNAVKFTASGVVAFSVAEHRDDVLINVEDSGPGIDKEQLPHVFEAFSQFTRDTSAKPDGAGLGLAIALKIARLLGGSITAMSTPGKGSRFSVRLPKIAPEAAEDSYTPLD